ncbi:MAG: sortase [Thermoleophilia bacterium]
MEAQTYTRYRSSRSGARPLRRSGAGSETSNRSRPAEDAASPSQAADRRFSGLWMIKKATTLAVVAGMLLVAYTVWVFGYGYVEARLGQADLKSLFSVTGSGSVDSGYLRNEPAALQQRLGYLDPVGEISIPGIGVDLMVVQGADKEALKKGPGQIEETSLPGAGGNFAVAGDRVLYGAPFLILNEVRIGDEIRVKMPYATFVYTVRDSFIVTPDDISVLQPVGYEAITLLTCDPPWDIKQRIVIRGELVEVLPAGSDS